jgi:glucose 1-dehydrogenase
MNAILEGQTALVTGASQGIGLAVALRLAEAGANVVVNHHSHPEDAAHVIDAIEKQGREGIAVEADLARVDECRRLLEEGRRRFGRIDILVNNAGVEMRADFWDITEADYDRVLAVNLKGAFFTTQAFARQLIDAKRPGKIINMSSVHEELPFPHFTPYCMSKGGLKMMTRSLAVELAPFGITINSIAPGAIATPINTKLLNDPVKLKALQKNIPLRRLGAPADVAGAVVFLASRDADYITGTTLFVDGGLLWNYQEQ